MKRSELTDIIQSINKTSKNYKDHTVVIGTAVGGIPHEHFTNIRRIVVGGDWTSGFVIIHPDEELVPVNNIPRNKSIRELGRDHLEKLKSLYSFKDGKYIPGCREEEWLDGFVEGVRMHITGCQ